MARRARRVLVLEDGRVETGLLHAEDDQTVTLKVENDQLKTFPRKKIVGKPASTCFACHKGMGLGEKSAVLCGIDANFK